jgi:FAD/FMN-containing dehydrogenase
MIARGDDGYEERRRSLIWNRRVPDRFPETIHHPTTAKDVARLVGETIAPGKRIAARAGGHNWLAASLRDGGAVLDLGALNGVEVDAERKVAWAGPGATHQILADAIAPLGLAFPIGHCPSVGLGGYLLAGGMGWNLHTWGIGCANIRSAEVVLAGGHELVIDRDHEPDLFWALRGGSTAFPGIVTRFELRLFDLPAIASRYVSHGLDRLPEMLERIAGYLPGNPGLEIAVIVRRPIENRRLAPRFTVAATAFDESIEKAATRLELALSDLGALSGAVADSGARPVAFNELEGEGGWQEGFRHFADTTWATRPVSRIGEITARAIEDAPSIESRIVIAFAHSPGEADMAFTRLGDMTVNFYATWSDPADDDANVAWTRSASAALEPFAGGHYIGESDLSFAPDRVRRSYPADKFDRLARIVEHYDPQARFHTFLSPE